MEVVALGVVLVDALDSAVVKIVQKVAVVVVALVVDPRMETPDWPLAGAAVAAAEGAQTVALSRPSPPA